MGTVSTACSGQCVGFEKPDHGGLHVLRVLDAVFGRKEGVRADVDASARFAAAADKFRRLDGVLTSQASSARHNGQCADGPTG